MRGLFPPEVRDQIEADSTGPDPVRFFTAGWEKNMEHKKNTKSFASRWGFILASVGSAVGMANVWGFPNKMGSNGGGAFLLIYLLFVFIFSYVGLPAEFAMGRRAATGTLGAYENAWDTRSKSAGKVGGLLGWLPLAGSLCIAIGYAVIVTYVLKLWWIPCWAHC